MNARPEQTINPSPEANAEFIQRLIANSRMPNERASKTDIPQKISITGLATPLGPMIAGATVRGICLLEFSDRHRLSAQIKSLHKWLQAEYIEQSHPLLEQLQRQLDDYFKGRLTTFTLPLDVSGTRFQKQVWQALQQIPFATTRSYLQQAQAIGNDKAVRAVASANANNRIAIIIPCHRVIGSNGKLTGYAGGLWRKQKLLELEGAIPHQSGIPGEKM